MGEMQERTCGDGRNPICKAGKSRIVDAAIEHARGNHWLDCIAEGGEVVDDDVGDIAEISVARPNGRFPNTS